jgi:hypothetical protein
MAVSLAGLTKTQLPKVQHMLPDSALDAVMRANMINPRTQAHARELKLIAKVLNSERSDLELAELEVLCSTCD